MVAAPGAASCLLDPARLLYQDTADPGRERASGDISVGPVWESLKRSSSPSALRLWLWLRPGRRRGRTIRRGRCASSAVRAGLAATCWRASCSRTQPGARPAVHHRAQAGRRQQHRRRVRRACAGRRLHPVPGHLRQHHQRHAVVQSVLRLHQGLRAHHAHGVGAQHSCRPPRARRGERPGADRARKGQARPDPLCDVGRRIAVAHVRRAAQFPGGHQAGACAVSGQRTGDDRCARRARHARPSRR